MYGYIMELRTQEAVTARLKILGFKYLMIDLLLPTLDRTPEKSLTEKYKITINGLLYNNPGMRLLATDRMIRTTLANGQKREMMGVFGKEIPNFGTYAVFEIL